MVASGPHCMLLHAPGSQEEEEDEDADADAPDSRTEHLSVSQVHERGVMLLLQWVP